MDDAVHTPLNRRSALRQERVLAQVRAFHYQPDAARVPAAVVDALIGKSSPTRWRYIKQGKLPRPGADGAFSAVEIRAALTALGSVR